MRLHSLAHQCELWMWLIEGACHGEIGCVRFERCAQARDQVERKKRGIARHGDDEQMRGRRQTNVQTGERSCESADGIGHDAIIKRCVFLGMLIGVDEDLFDLRTQAPQHMAHHRPAVENDQTLVDGAHAPALTAGQNDTRYRRDRLVDGGLGHRVRRRRGSARRR